MTIDETSRATEKRIAHSRQDAAPTAIAKELWSGVPQSLVKLERIQMNGAEILLKTAAHCGIEVCFTNPGTTELPLVSAFDSIAGIRPVLGLFEGCCTGAADGYARMTDKPAMTLLHLGPGLAYGLANLHNAKRAHTPVVNIIGEHATWHRPYDPPLAMDIEELTDSVSGWQCTTTAVQSLSHNTADAIAAALQGQVATLIVPHDCQWSEVSDEKIVQPQATSSKIDTDCLGRAAKYLAADKKAALILGGRALRKRGLQAAGRIKAITGCDLLSETSPARMDRGVGIPAVKRIPYFPGKATGLLSQYQVLVFIGAREPIVFFGYEGGKSKLLTEAQQAVHISSGQPDLPHALEQLAQALDAPSGSGSAGGIIESTRRPELPEGPLTAQYVCTVLAALQPEGAIIVDESVTTGGAYYPLAESAPEHSWLTLTGGAIGQGMPCAVGAAIACPDRPVINLQADGSAMYTVQALWMQARESLNITTLICSNRSYGILNLELLRTGKGDPGPNAQSLMDLGNPPLDWVHISKGMGVPAVSVDSAEQLAEQLKIALNEPGPHLVEMIL
jgi:acetolactate synthase-1/2/3 large subunit